MTGSARILFSTITPSTDGIISANRPRKMSLYSETRIQLVTEQVSLGSFHETQPRKVPTLMSLFSPRRLPLCRGESHEPVGSKVQYRGTLGGHSIKQTKPLLLAPFPSQSWEDNPLSQREMYRSCSPVPSADESLYGKNTPDGLARGSSET